MISIQWIFGDAYITGRFIANHVRSLESIWKINHWLHKVTRIVDSACVLLFWWICPVFLATFLKQISGFPMIFCIKGTIGCTPSSVPMVFIGDNLPPNFPTRAFWGGISHDGGPTLNTGAQTFHPFNQPNLGGERRRKSAQLGANHFRTTPGEWSLPCSGVDFCLGVGWVGFCFFFPPNFGEKQGDCSSMFRNLPFWKWGWFYLQVPCFLSSGCIFFLCFFSEENSEWAKTISDTILQA